MTGNYVQVYEVLDAAGRYHSALHNHYTQWAGRVKSRRVSLLLEQIGREEAEFEERLTSYGKEQRDRSLDIWIQFSPDQRMLKNPSADKMDNDATTLQVGILASDFDQALINFYAEAARRVSSGSARDLFQGLTEIHRYRKTMHSLKTMHK
jgi:hypothetical protein